MWACYTESMRAIFVGLLIMALGCAAGGPAAGPSSEEITEPWVSMALPTSDGVVTASEAAALTVLHDEGDPASFAERYGAAIEAAGWAMELNASTGGTTSISYVKDERTLSLAVTETLGSIYVVLSLQS